MKYPYEGLNGKVIATFEIFTKVEKYDYGINWQRSGLAWITLALANDCNRSILKATTRCSWISVGYIPNNHPK